MASRRRQRRQTGAHATSGVRSGVHLGVHARRMKIAIAIYQLLASRSLGDLIAYIIASSATGIPIELPTIFPGAHITPWEPFERTLRGRAGETLRYVEERLRGDPTCAVPGSDGPDRLELHQRPSYGKSGGAPTSYRHSKSVRLKNGA